MSDDKLKVPIFDGHYEHWSEMMENLLRSKQVWNLIDPGIREPAVGIAQSEGERKKLEELRVKDMQVKHYLYQAIDRVTFEQILDRKTSKAIWDSMKKRFAGNERVKKSMLQKLRRDFEILEMKSNETIPEYFGRVLTISNQMRSNGETMLDVKIVEKILRTLTEKYMFVVVSIEESKDIEQMSIEELQSTLVVHEQKFKKNEKEEEHALKVDTGDSSSVARGRGRGRSSYRGRGRGRSRYSINRETVECYNCHKLGHYSYECSNAKEANYAGFDENEEIMLLVEEQEDSLLMAQSNGENKGQLWFLDSGCSNHMCGNKERFVDMDLSFSNTVKLGNNTRMTVEGKGNVKLVLSGVTYVIKEVYYVPDLKNNLLSIGQLQQRGLSFLFQSDVCKVFHPEKGVFHPEKGLVFQSKMSTNRMYPLSEDTYPAAADQKTVGCLYSSDDETTKLWHERLGHISHTSMKTLQTKCMVRDLPKLIIGESICEDCVMGKQTREAIPKFSSWRAKEILELVHSDICGPITPTSHTGKRYFLSFIDDFSRKGWVYFLTEKSQAFDSFKEFKKKVETETGKVVKALRTDRGGEYLSNEFSSFCREHGIKRQLTTSFTPQQNGVAERKNRTVINMVVTLLSAKNMPKMFWAEATCWSFYVLNRSTTKALSDMTPQEAWSGSKPTVNHFRVWGCLAYVHVPKEKRTKLENKSVVCVLTGISEESKAYRLVNPKTMKAITSRDVIFEENKEWNWNQSKKSNVVDEELSWGNYDFIDEDYIFIDDHGDEQPMEPEQDQQDNDAGPSVPLAREGRRRRTPSYLQDFVSGEELDAEDDEANAIEIIQQDPTRFEDAVKDIKWKEAMDREIEMIEKNQTWKLVELPKGAKCIGVKWVFKTKLNERGEIEKHKARLVARGYGQEYGIDYTEVYAPVARMDTIRLMLPLAAQRGWNIYQMDVKSAFLHGTLQEDVYVQQPQGYVVKIDEHKVYKLHKALYGLKQAPRAWYSRIEAYFFNDGFTKSKNEHTLFIKEKAGEKQLFVNVYVDDLIFTGNDEKMKEEFKSSMKAEFKMTDLGKMRYFLGVEVIQNSTGIHISQKKYAIDMLTRFKMLECNSVVNPIVPGCRLKIDDGEPIDETLFKQLVGSLMYITTTRPDIQFVVSFISRFMAKPTDIHLAAAKRVMRYIQGTLDYGIWYKKSGKGKLEIFTDSDFAGDSTDRKSTSGNVILWNEAAVSWSSKKQGIVALSSTEAENVAAATCACQVIWFREIMEELGVPQIGVSVIKCDNTSAIQLSRNPVFHGRCKHIGVRFHFLRDLVSNGTIALEYVETQNQVADILTKPLHRIDFQRLRERLGVCSLKDKQDLEA